MRLTECATSVKVLDRRNLIEIVHDVLAVELADERLDVIGFIRCNGTERSATISATSTFWHACTNGFAKLLTHELHAEQKVTGRNLFEH